jgi:hypothetical protein
LDVDPKSQVKDSILYSSEIGFKEALAGVYSLLVTEPLYVRELRFGMLGVLAREWSNFPTVGTSGYQDEQVYDYDPSNPTRRINAVWSGMYNAITNANVLLEMIDNRKNLFSGVNYEIIKGEALALRAFIHFDLLRMFGQAYGVAPNHPSIPYVTTYSHLQSPQLSVAGVIEKVLEDLALAAKYLESDPIFTGEVITEMNDNGYLMNRQLRINYYAVRALQARVHLYKGEYLKAMDYAQEVINSGKFTWVSPENMNGDIDFTGASEQIFGIDVNNLSTIARNYISPSGGSSAVSLTSARRSDIFENITVDLRYNNLLRSITVDNVTSANFFLMKYHDPATSAASFYRNKMSMIKLAEMHYIVAECQHVLGGDYLEALNAVREARLVPDLLPEHIIDFERTLVGEYLKEFIGEGQLFFLYKRRNLQSILFTDMNIVDLKGYVFPLPDAEFEGANRQPNR